MARKLLPGIHVLHEKHTREQAPLRMPPPATVKIPLSMSIGRPAVPVVKPGDKVQVGQLIAEAGGFVSAPVHSSVSGTVKKLEEVQLFHGGKCQAVLIESDGEQTPWEGLHPPELTDFDSFIAAVSAGGLVGLGGATFPTAVKLKVDPEKVEYICVNGAECEPYITVDARTMMDSGEMLDKGFALLERFYPRAKIIVGIENNKPKSIARLKELTADNPHVEIRPLPSLYPQGAEKVLIHNVTGRIVPEGKLPIDVGCVVINTGTLAALATYIETGMPLVKRAVTVDGNAVKEPKNVVVPIGTSVQDVIDFAGGLKAEAKKIILGGPMMGISIPSTAEVVVKGTGAILCFTEAEAAPPEPTACIRCGRCVDTCPLHLMPVELHNAYDRRDAEALGHFKINLCMECGCCAHVCPAGIRLVEGHKLSKAFYNDYLRAKKAEEEKKAAKAAGEGEKK